MEDVRGGPYEHAKKILRIDANVFFTAVFAVLSVCALLIGVYEQNLWTAQYPAFHAIYWSEAFLLSAFMAVVVGFTVPRLPISELYDVARVDRETARVFSTSIAPAVFCMMMFSQSMFIAHNEHKIIDGMGAPYRWSMRAKFVLAFTNMAATAGFGCLHLHFRGFRM